LFPPTCPTGHGRDALHRPRGYVGRSSTFTAPMITHRFPLSEWKRAISTIARVKRTGAVKVLLRPT
jgi:hypothetical protein